MEENKATETVEERTPQFQTAENAAAGSGGEKSVPEGERSAPAATPEGKTPVPETACLPEEALSEPDEETVPAGQGVPSFWNWFLTFFVMDIPVFGLITLIIWSVSKNTDAVKKSFARARILYRLLFTGLSLLVLYLLYKAALPMLESMLDYLQRVK